MTTPLERQLTHRTAPLESRWTRNRRLLQGPGGSAAPPPVDYEVTGTLTPDSTGDYYEDGTHNEQPKYKREDGAYFIWYESAMPSWLISDTPGDSTVSWLRIDPAILGEYGFNLGTEGTATVQLP